MAIECKHGQLARSCNICALEAELAAAMQDAERWRYTQREGYFEIRQVAEGGVSWVVGIEPERGTAEWRKGHIGIWTTGHEKTREAAVDAAIKREKRLAERIGSFAFGAMLAAPPPPEVEPAAVAEAVAAEREACAKICESVWDAWDAANEIRARGEKGQT